MKKYSIICIFLATFVLLNGCKKDQDTVTLSAVINHPSKVFINDQRYPCWEGGDAIYINDDSYSINGNSINTNNRTIAEIQGVTVSTNGYRAIYPASIVADGSDISGTNPVTVTLPRRQVYGMTEVGGTDYQKIRIPMGAYISSGKTLQFSNLCSVVRVTVDNPSTAAEAKEIQEISLNARDAYLSGTGSASITENDETNKISIVAGGNKDVTLSRSNPNHTMKTLNPGESAPFDIYVPEFGSLTNSDEIIITVKATTGYKKIKVENAYLNHSSIVSIMVDVATLKPLPAKLVGGPTFNSRVLPNLSGITKILFKYNDESDHTGAVELQTDDSPTPIYGYVGVDESNNPCYVVSTAADSILANSECGRMFKNMTSLQEIEFGSQFNTKNTTSMYEMFYHCTGLTTVTLPSTFYTNRVNRMDAMFSECTNLESITIPEEFNTANVTTMWSMFKDCSHLTSINFPNNFNTSSVTTMQAMFDNCSRLVSLDLSTFNTAQVQTMYAMFRNCKKLEDLTLPSNFNTARVTSMREMFSGCEKLESLTLPSNFTTASVTTMEGMFKNCKKFTTLDLSQFNTANVRVMAQMFYNCEKMQELRLGTDFTMATVEANLGNYDSQNNLMGRYGNMFYFTGKTANGNPSQRCTVYCTSDVQEFFADDRDGTINQTYSHIAVNNAHADYCIFTDIVSQ